MECWSVGVLECWSVGVLECWSDGVLECWSVGVGVGAGVLVCWCAGVLVSGSPHRLEANGSPNPKAASLQYSNTPILRCSVALSLLQLLSFDLRVMRARFGS